jgi:hypothetical protein
MFWTLFWSVQIHSEVHNVIHKPVGKLSIWLQGYYVSMSIVANLMFCLQTCL